MSFDKNEQRWLRDLEWAVTSPFLMESPLPLEPFDVGEIELPSTRFNGHRVGYYFESLIEFWLEHVRGVDMIAKGHQVIENGRTLGELDFVFRDTDGQVHHWEVAVKFYLYSSVDNLHGSHFIGPNAGDTFERKRHRLIDHQLPLSRSVFPEIDQRSAFAKGRIFYHPNGTAPETLAEGLAPDHLRAIWLRHSELKLLESPDTAYRILQKPHWLTNESGADLLSFGELNKRLRDHFSEQNHPVLLATMRAQESAWSECSRVFVVSDRWPD